MSFDALANENFPAAVALFAAVGYLLGSIPFGVLITRGAGLGDVRSIGSGNIGATNVLRTGRKDLALLTLLLDGGKGVLAVLVARFLLLDSLQQTSITLATVAGGSAFLGHLFPVWLRFKGGKGVATFFGVLIAAAWPIGLAAMAAWLLAAAASRYSSLAAIVAVIAAPNFAAFTGQPRPVIVLAVVMGVLILLKHRANLARLRAGTEPRIGQAGRVPEPPVA